MNGPLGAGLPALPAGMRWKNKLIVASGTFDPVAEAPLAMGTFFVAWGGGGAGGCGTAGSGANSGGHGQMFASLIPVEITGPATVTIGAGGAAANATPNAGGDTTLTWTNADGVAQKLIALGAPAGVGTTHGFTPVHTPAIGLTMATPAQVYAKTQGQPGRINPAVVAIPTLTVSAGDGTLSNIFMFTGGIIAGAPGDYSTIAPGAGGYRGKGGDGTTIGSDGKGYSSGGGAASSGGNNGGAGKQGFADFWWMEPI